MMERESRGEAAPDGPQKMLRWLKRNVMFLFCTAPLKGGGGLRAIFWGKGSKLGMVTWGHTGRCCLGSGGEGTRSCRGVMSA